MVMTTIYCICGMGFGTSLMLKMAISDILGKHNIDADVSAWDLGSAKGVKTDLFVMSEDMKNNVEGLEGKIVFVKDMTNEKEIEDVLLRALKSMGKI
jgi:PTS system ascorbate-specific IIB component